MSNGSPRRSCPAPQEVDRLVRPREAARILGVSLSQVYRWAKAGRLPAPTRLSHKVSGWRLSAIVALRDGAAA